MEALPAAGSGGRKLVRHFRAMSPQFVSQFGLGNVLQRSLWPCVVIPSPSQSRRTDSENAKAATVAMRSVHQMAMGLKRYSVSG